MRDFSKKMIAFVNALFSGILLSTFSSCAESQSFKQDDILSKLNGRYHNTIENCSGKSAFYCSGVLLSGDGSWEDGDSSDDSASFSYLRRDMSITLLYPVGYGYIFKTQNEAITDGTARKLYCAYTLSASTTLRPDSSLGPGCGTQINDVFYNSCEEAGVKTLSDFHNYINSHPGGPAAAQCAFDAEDPTEVNIMIKAHDSYTLHSFNEVVLNGWYWSNGELPPIEAFFYEVQTNNEYNVTNARKQRQDYESKTGLHVPLVGIDLTKTESPFVYAE